jgi:ABC-type sugar transport system permease subunit
MERINLSLVRSLEFGFATAMAWIYFLIVIAVIGIAMALISKKVYYYE